MYNNGQFDGNAAFSGGGFMPSQATQSADPSFSPAKNRESQTLVPLTVKQMNDALLASGDKSSLTVDGVDINNVTLVGMVSKKTERVTDVTFVLDDGTGKVDVQRWVNEPFEIKEMEKVQDGMYVRVFANLRGFQGKRQLVAHSTRPVKDFNELTYHFLECMYVHSYNTTLRVGGAPVDVQTTSAVNVNSYRGHQATQSHQFAGHGAKLDGVHQLILDYLMQPINVSKVAGVHVEELAQQCSVPVDVIRESAKQLLEEGFVYCTVDDDHYKCTANF